MYCVGEIGELLGVEPRGGAAALGVSSFCIDSREARPGSLFVALPGEHVDGAAYARDAIERGAVAVLASMDADLEVLPIGVTVIAVEDPIAALGKLAAHHRQRLRGRVVAITGSAGKTTTKEIAHWVLGWSRTGSAAPASYNNALGVALSILRADVEDDYLICEVGTNAPGEIAELAEIVRPDVAVITCVGPTHLQGLGTVDAVAREKLTLLNWIRPGGCAVINSGDPRLADVKAPDGVSTVRYGVACDAEIVGHVETAGIDGIRVRIEGLEEVGTIHVPLLGRHNAINVLAGVVAARMCDRSCLVPDAWPTLSQAPMRMQLVTGTGATFLNDAYNANPQSMQAALQTLSELPAHRRLAVLGDMRELGSESDQYHLEIGRAAAALGVDVLVTVGAAAAGIATGARGAGLADERICETTDVDHARLVLGELGGREPGNVVLLKASRAIGLERLLG